MTGTNIGGTIFSADGLSGERTSAVCCSLGMLGLEKTIEDLGTGDEVRSMIEEGVATFESGSESDMLINTGNRRGSLSAKTLCPAVGELS